jgi:hypothetical protein
LRFIPTEWSKYARRGPFRTDPDLASRRYMRIQDKAGKTVCMLYEGREFATLLCTALNSYLGFFEDEDTGGDD